MKTATCGLLVLSLTVAAFWGCSKGGSGGAKLNSEIDFTDPTSVRNSGSFGVYEDGWVGVEAEVALGNTAHSPLLWIEGTNVETKTGDEALRISVLAAGDTIDVLSIPSPGDFRKSTLLPRTVSNQDSILIRLIPSKSFVPSKLGTSKDDRTLSFRLRKIQLAPLAGNSDFFPSSFTFPRETSGDPNVQGIYDDGWMADSASVNLYNPDNKKMVEIRGTVPGNAYKGPAALDLLSKGQLLQRQQIEGNFRVQLLLPQSVLKERQLVLSLKPSATFVPADLNINSDHRRLSYQIKSIVLK